MCFKENASQTSITENLDGSSSDEGLSNCHDTSIEIRRKAAERIKGKAVVQRNGKNTNWEKRKIKKTVKGQVRGWCHCSSFKRLHCCEWCVVLFSIFSLLICEITHFNLLRSANWRHSMQSHFTIKAVCHVTDWPLQSELTTTDFFVNLCILNKGGLIFLTFYGRRKSEDHQPFKFPILCIVIITQSNA